MSSDKRNNIHTARLYPERSEDQICIPEGRIGLELETQRIDGNGHLALTPHPFEDEPFIDRDFGEAQIEINTPPVSGPEEAEALLHEQLYIIHRKLAGQNELLWPFSCPPALGADSGIRIAEYKGELEKKTNYRQYLASKYGKRIMTLCGIHFNYSFSEEVLRKNFAVSGEEDYRTYKDTLYLQLAEKVLNYSWVIVALLSASPLTDSSYRAGTPEGQTVFTGFSSLRCSREGYWNTFDPVLSYEDIFSYSDSIKQYTEKKLLRHEGELYYPVRIKPAGRYSLRRLCESGAGHIELRMIDLNPLTVNGIDRNDLRFLQMFLIWLASQNRIFLDEKGQDRALRNLKDAARVDWNDIMISVGDGAEVPLTQELERVLTDMADFFRDAGPAYREALRNQKEKVICPDRRYAQQVIAKYGNAYLSGGLERARQLQEEFLKGSGSYA